MDTKHKIHAFYILLFLVSTIVLLISVKWGEIPSLAQYFSFALTLSSLLLAVLDIIYSFYSSSANSQNIALLSNLSTQIAGSTSGLATSADQIGKYIEALPTHLKNVQGKVEETQQMIKEYYQAQGTPTSAKQQEISKLSTEQAERFLSKASFSGLGLLYACSLATSSGNEVVLDLKEFAMKTRLTTAEYLAGFAIASNAIGVVSTHLEKEMLSITDVHPIISKNVKKQAYKRAEESTNSENWKADLVSIEKLFSAS